MSWAGTALSMTVCWGFHFSFHGSPKGRETYLCCSLPALPAAHLPCNISAPRMWLDVGSSPSPMMRDSFCSELLVPAGSLNKKKLVPSMCLCPSVPIRPPPGIAGAGHCPLQPWVTGDSTGARPSSKLALSQGVRTCPVPVPAGRGCWRVGRKILTLWHRVKEKK